VEQVKPYLYRTLKITRLSSVTSLKLDCADTRISKAAVAEKKWEHGQCKKSQRPFRKPWTGFGCGLSMPGNQGQNPKEGDVARTVGGRDTSAAREGLASEVVDRVVIGVIPAIRPICSVLSVIGKRSNTSVVRDFHSERPASGANADAFRTHENGPK